MVKISLINWNWEAKIERCNNGFSLFSLKLYPEAERYNVIDGLMTGWIDPTAPQKIVKAKEYYAKFEYSEFDMQAYKGQFVTQIRQIIDRTCTDAILWQQNSGLCCESSRKDLTYILTIAIMKGIEKNVGTEIVKTKYINLVDIQRNMGIERAEYIRRVRQVQEDLLAAHLVEEEFRRKYQAEFNKASEDLLFSLLNEAEKKEIKEEGTLTIDTLIGTFVIPVKKHGFVSRCVDGQYEASYCIVFKDYSIPYGDEVLMKYVMLKTEPQRFIGTANRFSNRGV